MRNNNIKILSTRPLEATAIEAALNKGIAIHQVSFIDTSSFKSEETVYRIRDSFRLSITVIFTSMAAVEAVAEYLDDAVPDWRIYCIGNTTQQLVARYFGNTAVVETAANASELAVKILENRAVKEVTFFCGDMRRDELPDILSRNNIQINEVQVYVTRLLSHQVNENYDGILFFSPSAVISFFGSNKISGNTILFAIGDTTAEEIRKYTGNTIIISATPGKKNMVEQMISHFTIETNERIKE